MSQKRQKFCTCSRKCGSGRMVAYDTFRAHQPYREEDRVQNYLPSTQKFLADRAAVLEAAGEPSQASSSQMGLPAPKRQRLVAAAPEDASMSAPIDLPGHSGSMRADVESVPPPGYATPDSPAATNAAFNDPFYGMPELDAVSEADDDEDIVPSDVDDDLDPFGDEDDESEASESGSEDDLNVPGPWNAADTEGETSAVQEDEDP
ncbi:hypothetical protein OE88DRAFT_1731907, partial [Heliocybe sulcata]